MMQVLVKIVGLLSIQSIVNGFKFSTPKISTLMSMSKISKSELKMSDTFADVSIINSDADPKYALLSDVKSYSRTQMNEYVLQLEKINPTFNPATDDGLNGAWEIVSTGNLDFLKIL